MSFFNITESAISMQLAEVGNQLAASHPQLIAPPLYAGAAASQIV